MYFSKVGSGFRGYFCLVDTEGLLVPERTSEQFSVTIVSPDDTGSTSPLVYESSQKGGLYFFDVPTSFPLTHGVGIYGVVVEVSCDQVVDAFSETLSVSQADFDSLQNLGNAILGNVV